MPKLFSFDTGLCCSLMQITESEQIKNHPLRGALFENFIVQELMKARYNQGQRINFYFWRDRTGNEIDLLIDRPTGATPVEIKSSSTFHPDFNRGINYWTKVTGKDDQAFVVYTGNAVKFQNTNVLNWRELQTIPV